MHRFHLPPDRTRDAEIVLPKEESHHAVTVLRIHEGERVVVLDGAGTELNCTVLEADRKQVRLRVTQRHPVPPLPYQLTLIQAVTKGKTMDVIVQKATELGVHRIVPVLSDRTVAQLDDERAGSRLEKWQAVTVEAVKQCGSGWLPKVEAPLPLKDFLSRRDTFDVSLLASLQSDARHPRLPIGEFATERKRAPRSIAVWIGPEGDFTPAEINAIRGTGALPITLGQLVLRSETAAIYCLSVLNYELQSPPA